LGVTGVSTLTGGAVVQGMTVGLGAGAVSTNTTVGALAMVTNTTGSSNTGVGYGVLNSNSTGNSNTGIGYLALTNTTGGSNTGIGSGTLGNNIGGNNNVAVGSTALSSNSTGNSNVCVGAGAILSGTAVNFNTAVGHNALSVVTGDTNIAVGYLAGNAITSGTNNVVIGGYTGSAAPISATGNNWIVLSDGAGTVRQAIDPAGNTQFSTGAVVVYAPAPASFAALATLTAANLQTQLIVTTGTSFTLTMPSGSDLDTLINWSGVDLGFDFSLINTASSTITMAANTGVTTVGRLTVLTAVSARFRIRRTAASTYILYRIG
jgi:hypothetical protein